MLGEVNIFRDKPAGTGIESVFLVQIRVVCFEVIHIETGPWLPCPRRYAGHTRVFSYGDRNFGL